jgi:hypothetical protein
MEILEMYNAMKTKISNIIEIIYYHLEIMSYARSISMLYDMGYPDLAKKAFENLKEFQKQYNKG